MRLSALVVTAGLLGAGTAAAQQIPPQDQTSAQATPQHDYRRLTLQLKPGMTEREVTNLMGEPRQSALTGCGQNTGKPFQCKILSYGFGAGYVGGNGIAVVFGQNETTGEWLVVGWQ